MILLSKCTGTSEKFIHLDVVEFVGSVEFAGESDELSPSPTSNIRSLNRFGIAVRYIPDTALYASVSCGN